LLHPWRDARSVSRGLRRDPETPFGYREELGPERPSQQFISVALWLSDRVQSTAEGIVTLAGEAPGLVWVRQAGNGDLFVTERVRVDPNDDWMISVRLGPQGQDRERYPVDVHPWSKPRRRAR
jgi:hypothetical protein